jgi:hypothetical protein
MTVRRALNLACVLGLVALALIVWSVLVPRPVPVFLAMTLAQGIGTLSFLLFLATMLRDFRRVPITAPDEKIRER